MSDGEEKERLMVEGKMTSVMEKYFFCSIFVSATVTIFWSKNFGIVLEVFGMFQIVV